MRIRTPSPFPDLQPVPSRLIISFLLYILSCFPIPFWCILHHFQFPIPLLRFYPLKPILLIHSSSSSTPPPPLLSPLHPFSIFPSLHSRIFKYPLSSPLSLSTSSPFPPTTFPTQCLRGLTLGVVPQHSNVLNPLDRRHNHIPLRLHPDAPPRMPNQNQRASSFLHVVRVGCDGMLTPRCRLTATFIHSRALTCPNDRPVHSVKCDLKDLQASSTTTGHVACSNCQERNLKCVYVLLQLLPPQIQHTCSYPPLNLQ